MHKILPVLSERRGRTGREEAIVAGPAGRGQRAAREERHGQRTEGCGQAVSVWTGTSLQLSRSGRAELIGNCCLLRSLQADEPVRLMWVGYWSNWAATAQCSYLKPGRLEINTFGIS